MARAVACLYVTTVSRAALMAGSTWATVASANSARPNCQPVVVSTTRKSDGALKSRNVRARPITVASHCFDQADAEHLHDGRAAAAEDGDLIAAALD